jgi:predicted O-methyltransferase YrrM
MSVKVVVAWLRRGVKSLFVVNLATLWLFLREGKKRAVGYMRQVLTLYLHRAFSHLPTIPPLLPSVAVTERFPGIDLSQVELLFPLPRPGGVSVEELIILACLVRHLKPKRLVEIGTAEGRTTLNLALHSPPDAEVITFDLPPTHLGATVTESGLNYRQMGISEPGCLFREHPLSAKIRLILADSTQFDWSPFERSVDFVFIDGAHDYESVRKDSQNALRIVRPGGVILWHDYGVMDGVTLCLNEQAEQLPIVWLKGTTLACFVWEG